MWLRRFSGVGFLIGGLLLLASLGTALMVAEAGDAAGTSPGPVAVWSFDEGEGTTVEDVTGDGHTATIEGAKWVRGRYGDGLEFEGSEHDVVKVPASSELNFAEEFTLEAWVRPASSTDKLAPIVGKTTGGGSGSKSLSYYLYAGNSESKPYGEVQHVLGTGKKATASSAPPGGTWSHLALTYDGAKERLFVNGVQVAETTTEAPVTTTGELQIGAETEHGEYFSGRIDEVRIYNRVLKGTEVGADMETPILTPKGGLVAAWSFDEGEGTTVEDVTGDGHTATIEGAKWARGRYGDGLEFKGSEHSVVKVPASSELNFEEEFTLEAWVRPASSTDKLAPVLGKTTGGGSGSKSLSYYLYAGNSESRPYGEVQHVLGTGKKATASSAPPGSTWTHLALTYDGAKERLFVNGVQVSETASEAPVTTTGELQIGAETEHGEYFSGRIDEVRIYNRVLDGAEVGSDMEAPLETPKQGPVAAWSFDEGEGTTVEDVTGDGHTATIEGAEWTDGRYGGALNFGSGSPCVSVPDSPELRLSEEFTLEAWIKPVGGLYEDPIVVRESGGKPAFGLGIGDHGEGEPEGFIGTGKGSEVAVGGDIGINEWTPVAATYDGGRIRVYEDGELVGEKSATTPPVTGEGPLKIGCDTPDGPFTGKIDEVRVYNRALDGAEVDADTEAPLITPKQAPVAAYSFDEGEGTTVEDVTGDGHTATIKGATWSTDGRYGDALEFDAAKKDVLKIPASSELDFGEEFTLEAWVRPSSASNKEAPLIDKQEGGALGYFLYEGGSVSDRPYGAAAEGQEFVHADEPLPADAWSHVALTFTGNRTWLYVDGELVDNGAAEPTVTSEGELEIGGSTDSADWFDGRIDEVRIYNRAINVAEVDADMEAPIHTPKEGPVAAYSFDGGTGSTAEDVTGDGHTATIHGAKWSTHGRYGGAMEFAEGDWLSVPASPELDLTEEFTLEAWIHPETKHEFDDILSKETAEEPSRFAYLMADHHGQFATYFGEYPENAHYSPGEEIKPHTWTHVAVVDGGGRIHLYLNGEEVESGPAPSIISSDGELRIGSNRFLESHNDFIGRIDEVRIYDRALNGAEVGTDMEAPIASPKPGPTAAWSFDERGGNTAFDTSGEHDGHISGATWVNGKFGSALEFAGAEEDIVTVPPSQSFEVTGFTIEAWVRPREWSPNAPIFSDASPQGSGFALYAGGTKSGIPEGNLTYRRKRDISVFADRALPLRKWSFVSLVNNGRELTLFIDGRPVDTVRSDLRKAGSGPIQIGGSRYLEPNEFFTGGIDEVRFYNRPLAQGEIARDEQDPVDQETAIGPVASYPLDEGAGTTAHDATGNGNDGAIEGPEWTTGRFGDALKFDAASHDVVTIPDSESLRLRNFTLEAWILPEESGAAMPVLSKMASGERGLAATADALVPGGELTSGETTKAGASGSEALEVGKWAHVAVTSNGKRMRVFVDGQLVDEESSEEVVVGKGPLQIGGATSIVAPRYFDGKIDEIRVYDRALTRQEVAHDSRASVGGPVLTVGGPLFEDRGAGPVSLDGGLTLEATDSGAHLTAIRIAVDGEEQEVLPLEEALGDGATERCRAGSCVLRYTVDDAISNGGISPGPHEVDLTVEDELGRATTARSEVILDTEAPELELSGSLATAQGAPLEGGSGTLDIKASDPGAIVRSGLESVMVLVDGVVAENFECTPGCVEPLEQNFEFDEDQWGQGPHVVSVVAFDHAGNSAEGTFGVNSDIAAMQPKCSEASAEVGEAEGVITDHQAVEMLETRSPNALAEGAASGGFSQPHLVASQYGPERIPAYRATMSVEGGWVGDPPASLFTAGGSICLTPTKTTESEQSSQLVGEGVAAVRANSGRSTDTFLRPTPMGIASLEDFRGDVPAKRSWSLAPSEEIEVRTMSSGGLAFVDPSGVAVSPTEPPAVPTEAESPESLPDNQLQAEASFAEIQQAAGEFSAQIVAVVAPAVAVDSSGAITSIPYVVEDSGGRISVEPPEGTTELFVRLSAGVSPAQLCAGVFAGRPSAYAANCGVEPNSDAEYVTGYTWLSPERLAYTAETFQENHPSAIASSQLFTIGANGLNRQPLGDPHYIYRDPSSSPDGSEVAAIRCAFGEEECAIVRLAADGSEERVVLQTQEGQSFADPVYGDEGKNIYFFSDQESGYPEAPIDRQIDAISIDGTGLHQVTDVDNLVDCYHHRRHCNVGLWMPDGNGRLSAQPNGEALVFDFEGSLYSVAQDANDAGIGSGVAVELAPEQPGEEFSSPGLSANESELLFYRHNVNDTSRDGVWSSSLASPEEPELRFAFDAGRTGAQQPSESPDGGALALLGRGAIYAATSEGAAPHIVTDGDENLSLSEEAEAAGIEELAPFVEVEEQLAELGAAATASRYPDDVSKEEIAFCVKFLQRIPECTAFFADKETAEQTRDEIFTAPHRVDTSTLGNAFQHGYWVALMTEDSPEEKTGRHLDGLSFALTHEGPGPYNWDARQDVLNDFVGHNYTELETEPGFDEESICEGLRLKAGNAIFIGSHINPNRWAGIHNYAYRRLVYRKKRANRGNGPIVRLNGRTCAEAEVESH